MENHGLGTHNGKKCSESSSGNTPNTPQFIRAICPNCPIILYDFEKALITCPLSMCEVKGQVTRASTLFCQEKKLDSDVEIDKFSAFSINYGDHSGIGMFHLFESDWNFKFNQKRLC